MHHASRITHHASRITHHALVHLLHFCKMVVVCVLFPIAAYAQTTPPSQQQTPNQESTYQIPPFDSTIALRYRSVELECTVSTVINSVSLIRYRTFAKIYVNVTAKNGTSFTLRNHESGKSYSTTVKNDGVLFEHLESNQIYDLVTRNSCDKEVVISNITTSARENNTIFLSDVMFKTMTNWSMHPKNVPIDQFMSSLSNINYYERLSFYQQHILRDALIDDGLTEGLLPQKSSISKEDNPKGSPLDPMLDPTGPPPPGCMCDVFLTGSRQFSKGELVSETYIPNRESSGYIKQEFKDVYQERSNWRQSYIAGPGKYKFLKTEGSCDGYHYWEVVDAINGRPGTDQTNGSPNIASVVYGLVCTNYPDKLPAECACAKDIAVKANYDTELEVAIDASSQVFCGWSMAAQSSAEDIAALYAFRQTGNDTPEYTILQAGNGQVKREFSSTFNNEWLVQVLGLAATIAHQIDSARSTSVFIDEIKDGLVRVIRTPINDIAGTQGGTTKTGSLISYAQTLPASLQLKPNTVVTISLLSWSGLRGGGVTRWHSHAHVKSTFSLGGLLKSGVSNKGEEWCCSPPVASWMVSPGEGDASRRAGISNFYFSYERNIPVRTNWASYAPPITSKDCLIPELAPRITRGGNPEAVSFKVSNLDDGIYVTQNSVSENEFLLTDITGKVLQYYTGYSEGRIFGLGNQYPVGVYLLQIKPKAGGNTQVFKIFKTN